MWPGEQPPTGGPNPRDPQGGPQGNPYRQPGYQQPTRYGSRAPQASAVPPAPSGPASWNAPTLPATAPGGDGRGARDGRRTKAVAIGSAAGVVVAAAVTGTVLLGGGREGAAPAPEPVTSSAAPSATGDPRTGDGPRPTVAGWKVVVNPDLGIAFDVPADWALQSPDWVSYVTEDDDPLEKPLVAMKAPAVLKEKWCSSDGDRDGTVDDTPLASAGTRGDNGARNPAEAARADSANWVYGLYTQPDRGKVGTGPVSSFTTASGLTGSLATSSSSGVERRGRCGSDGKATTFAFENPDGDVVSWSFAGADGVGDEVPDTTVRQIARTVRLYDPASGS
ncbi:hypothetical protein ACFWHW_03490 [Streptomyces pharetrae]|uniref:hypothetical protein n=1 Tax=Streptomyces pharetrae TaxID=291370 RepID=UPI00365499DA